MLLGFKVHKFATFNSKRTRRPYKFVQVKKCDSRALGTQVCKFQQKGNEDGLQVESSSLL
jgi:hypothetical protein